MRQAPNSSSSGVVEDGKAPEPGSRLARSLRKARRLFRVNRKPAERQTTAEVDTTKSATNATVATPIAAPAESPLPPVTVDQPQKAAVTPVPGEPVAKPAEVPPSTPMAAATAEQPDPAHVGPPPDAAGQESVVEGMEPTATAEGQVSNTADQTPTGSDKDTGLEGGGNFTGLLISPLGVIVEAHASCASFVGWDVPELVGKDITETILPEANKGELIPEPAPDEEIVETKILAPVRVQIRTKDGEQIPAILSLKHSQRLNCWIAMLRREKPAPEPAPVEPPKESIVDKETKADFQKEREELLTRILADQTELHLLRKKLERERGRREKYDKIESEFKAAKSRIAELEDQVAKTTAEQATSLVKQPEDSAGMATADQQPGAPEALKRAEADLNAATDLIKELEDQLNVATAEKARLQEELGRSPATPASQSELLAAQARISDLEQQLAESTAEKDHLKERSDAAAAQSSIEALRKAEAESAAANARVSDLEQRLTEATSERTRLEEKLAEVATASVPKAAPGESDTHSVPEAGSSAAPEISSLQRRLRQAVTSLAKATSELENERGERARSERRLADLANQLKAAHEEVTRHLQAQQSDQQRAATLEQEVRSKEQIVEQYRADLDKELAERRLVEQQVQVMAELNNRLEANITTLQEAKNAFEQTNSDMEARLAAATKALAEVEEKMQRESAERQRLSEALAAAERKLQEHTETRSMELSRLQSARQLDELERKRLDGDILRSRYLALGSLRENQVLINRFRSELRPSIEDLRAATCQLLQTELPDEQKALVQNALEKVLMLQTTVQEGANWAILSSAEDAEKESKGVEWVMSPRSNMPADQDQSSDETEPRCRVRILQNGESEQEVSI